MKRFLRCVFFCVLTAVYSSALVLASPAAQIQAVIDETKTIALVGNTRHEANVTNDRGPVNADFPMSHMLLQLKRPEASAAALEKYIDGLNDSNSPNFHQWLTPAQFAATYGLAKSDVDTITAWLEAKGFTIDGVQPGGMLIEFSGTAGQVSSAFHTEIHKLEVAGVNHFANMRDPQIPAALEPVVAGIVSLHDFRPKDKLVRKPEYTYTGSQGTSHALVAGDIATIYNLNPLFAKGYSGQGQSIMVVEDTYLYSTADFYKFRNAFGLTHAYPSGSLSQISPKGPFTCRNPGFQGAPSDPGYGDDGEAAIDVEWASAAAPNAAIVLAACTDTTTVFGGLIALLNTLNGPWEKLPSVVSISYGESEAQNGAAANYSYYQAYQQAAAEGVSVFVSAGDEDAAESDGGNPSTLGISVSGFASTPYNVAVGGTDFGYTAFGVSPSVYWKASNGTDYSSAKSYIQEIPWNDSCAGGSIAAYLGVTPLELCNNPAVTQSSGALNLLLNAVGGSGGPSGCAKGTPSSAAGAVSGTCAGYAKPYWQAGLVGNPYDGVRDIPDVALFASNGFWDAYYVTCWSDPNTDPLVGGGFNCNGAPSTWAGFGGTSVSSPIMAGIQALVDQKTGSRWGNPNPIYYSLAKSEFGYDGAASCNSSLGADGSSKCIFHDITQGDNVGVCTTSNGIALDCFIPKGDSYGVLSTSDKKDRPAYLSTVGWDFTSGIGSVNAYNLVMNWPCFFGIW